MSERARNSLTNPFVGSIFHPTDFSAASHNAFAHALAIALIRRTRFDILNVRASPAESWTSFPSVRETLERWGLLAPGSDRSAVYDELAVRVRKVQLAGDPVAQTLDYVDVHRPDLIVVATEGRRGLARWIEPSVAQALARRSETMTLFVGAKRRSFVSLEDGHLSLRRILVPIDQTPLAQPAVLAAAGAAEALGDLPVEITLLHVGDGDPMPAYEAPEGDAWIWHERLCKGPIVKEIVAAAKEFEADLIVMPTEGRNGVFDALRGSFTERIVPQAPCPVLAVPSPSA